MLLSRVVAFALALTVSAMAWATHDEPGKGLSAKAALVTAYEPCTAPNTTTSGLAPFPACSPPVRSDPLCGFNSAVTSAASGRVKAKSRNFDVDLTIVAKGLSVGCEGRMLCGLMSVRVTTDRCTVSPCTVVDLIDIPAAQPDSCCIVTHGVCQLRTSINAEIFDALRYGERAGIELLGCALRRVDGPNLPTGHTFSCGLLAR
jgi:hypothetical protein